MKRLFSVIVLLAILTGICSCVYADEKITITNTEIKAENIPVNGTIIAALYDENMVLTGVRTYKGSEEKKYAEDMSEEIKKSETIKVFLWNMETIEPLGRVYGDRLENLPADEKSNTMTLTINGTEFTAELEDNETATAFKDLLPMTIDMSELNGNEKYYYMDSSLPTNSYRPGTINAGDIMLYGNNCLVVFYKTFSSSYSYTKIGHITNTEGLEAAVGDGNITAGFSLVSQKDSNNSISDITLNSGYTMPVLGLGTWTQNDETTANSVYCALKDGYRLIDTAQYYGNERGVGEGVRKAIEEGIVKREDVFITSKVMPMNYDNAYASINQSNEKIGLDYIDLMLIHQSGSNDKQVYRALEQAVKDGTVKSLGISNYYTKEEFDRITEGAEIMPAVVQNENHPFYQNSALQEYVKQYGTVVESYYPLGGRGHTQDLLGNETINEIANAHNKTAAQIILRWHIQAGYITIPGSSNPEHIAENYDIFDFELTDEEMQIMAALNTGNRYENW